MKNLLLTLCLVLPACAKARDLPERPAPDARLQAKYEVYKELAPADAHEDDCDGLLFRSLLESGAQRGGFDIEQWRDDNGKWHRNPTKKCERATSRDMVMGAMWYFWSHDRVDLAEDTWHYDGRFIMDQRDWTISQLYPDSIATLAVLINKLGGHDHNQRQFTPPCVGTLSGFRAHLQSLTIGLRALMGKGDDGAYECIKRMVDRQPNNAFYQAIKGLYTGDQSAATELLLNEQWWPADRLPTSKERCEPWLVQRDEGRDWLPCPRENKVHSGGDFVISAAIALGVL
jgi:hypothetical protein